MTNSYRPIPAPDYASGLRSQYGRDSQNLANLQNAMRRNDQRRVQVAGQGMELMGALANFSATAASKYQQVKEKRDIKRTAELSKMFDAGNYTAAEKTSIINAHKEQRLDVTQYKQLVSRLAPDVQEQLRRELTGGDILKLEGLRNVQALQEYPSFMEAGLKESGYDPLAPSETRRAIYADVQDKWRVESGTFKISPEEDVRLKFNETLRTHAQSLENNAASTFNKKQDELEIELANKSLDASINLNTGVAGNELSLQLTELALKKGNGNLKVGMPLAKTEIYSRLVKGIQDGTFTAEEIENLKDDIVTKGDKGGTFEELYMNADQVKTLDDAIDARKIELSKAIEERNKADRITTEETSMTTADSFITEGKIDEAKTELNNAYTALYKKGIKSTKLEQKIASLDFTTENLNAEREQLLEKLLDSQLTTEELNKAYYPNKVEFQDEVEKLERIKNTVEYKNNQKSLKALMQSELLVSGNDSFFRGYGASIHADLERRYRKNILINGATPAEAAAEVEQHYKINGGGIDGVNKGLKYSFNTNDDTHTAYGNQLGVGVRNLSIINKRNNIQNQLQSGKKIDQIKFFSKGEVEDIIENYQTTGKLNDFAKGSLHGIENKIEIINATAKSYGIDDEIEEPEGQEEFLNNLNPKDRTLINYMGIENLDVEILNRIVLYN